MKKLFMPYELAVIAKEKGFNENCLGYFSYDKEINIASTLFESNKNELFHNLLSAPLYQQIVDWFREKYDLFIIINPALGFVIRYNKKSPVHLNNSHSEYQTSYYEALNKAIEEAFKLI